MDVVILDLVVFFLYISFGYSDIVKNFLGSYFDSGVFSVGDGVVVSYVVEFAVY